MCAAFEEFLCLKESQWHDCRVLPKQYIYTQYVSPILCYNLRGGSLSIGPDMLFFV